MQACRAGQTVLVLGAGGGVGLAAVQIAQVVGAKVIAVTQVSCGVRACAFFFKGKWSCPARRRIAFHALFLRLQILQWTYKVNCAA